MDDIRYVGQALRSEFGAETIEAEASAINIVTNVETNALPVAEAADYESLVQYHGRRFVDATYITLLKRLPDADGLNFYLARLNDGTSKLQIIREIFFSQECRDAAIELPGLREAFDQIEGLQ